MKINGKRQTKKLILLASMLIIILALLIYFLQATKKPERVWASFDANLESVEDIPVITNFIGIESDRRPQIEREIKWIVIHETDNRGSSAGALNHDTFLHTDDSQVNSWHYTVDDSVIYHHLPDNEVGWHAGDKKTEDGGNMTGIGIEMCVNQTGDYQKTLQNTAKLIATLMVSYDLGMDEVKFHQDFSGKICPHRLITEGRVKEFRLMIEEEYNKLKEQEKQNESK